MSYGKYTYGRANLICATNDSKLEVGSFCSIAGGCNIYLGGNHMTNWVTTFPFGHIFEQKFNNFDGKGHPSTKGDVIIGNDVWIANNVTVMSGIKIGDGAVIAANSHVVKNVEAYSVVGGNPAKFIRFRFTPEQIEKLLEIKWWDWDDAKINKFTPLLCNDNIDAFLNAAAE